jgi:hypothetical protein
VVYRVGLGMYAYVQVYPNLHASLLQVLLPVCGMVLHNLALCASGTEACVPLSWLFIPHLLYHTHPISKPLVLYRRRDNGAL